MSQPAATAQPQTFTAQQAVELAVVERSGFIESRHIGSAVVVDVGAAAQPAASRLATQPAAGQSAGTQPAGSRPAGTQLLALGSADTPIFTRSCLKPLQAIACMEMGVPLTGEAAVLASASHKAERGHVEVVEKMLASVNLTEADLQCPSVPPADHDSRVMTRGTGRLESPVYFNCSGKHAAFLMAQKLNNQPPADYLDPDSAVQRQVVDVVTRFCGAAPAYTGVDGCGAPVHALTLAQLATGIGRVAAGTTSQAKHLIDCVFAHPWAIEGHGRPNSTVIERLGVFAKFGAEGVMVMSTTDGVCAAVKMLDGNNRASSLVALQLLVAVGALGAGDVLEVLGDIVAPVTGGTKSDGTANTVGEIKAGGVIQDLLRARAAGQDVTGSAPVQSTATPAGVDADGFTSQGTTASPVAPSAQTDQDAGTIEMRVR